MKDFFRISINNVIVMTVLSLILSVSIVSYVFWDYNRLAAVSIEKSTGRGTIPHAIDKVYVENNRLYVKGWALFIGHHIRIYKCRILLYDSETDKYYKMQTLVDIREDTTKSINDGINYDKSGFIASTSVNNLKKGFEYKIYILYQNDFADILVETTKTFTRM